MFLVLWEFDVKPGSEKRFESVYGPSGEWVKLFRHDECYQRTILLRDAERTHTYLTCDFWESREAYERFQRENFDAYLALDRACEGLTEAERKIGAFEQAADDA